MKNLLFIGIIIFSLKIYSQEKIKNKFEQYIEAETSNDMVRFTLDSKYIFKKGNDYLSHWGTYNVGRFDPKNSLPGYFINQLMYNKKINNKLIISVGYENLYNINTKESFNFVKTKIRYKLF